MKQDTENLMIWSCSHNGHEHSSWDEADLCAQLQKQIPHLEKTVILLLISSLTILTEVRRRSPVVDEKVEEARLEVYMRLRLKYEAAGEPYGYGEEGMWKWLHEVSGSREQISENRGAAS
ncbi:MAG TPA: hypothetical protein VFD58_12205 [Blastocatellia bacterium]|nr:hypothetical protein [Blastocatellia bacterium]